METLSIPDVGWNWTLFLMILSTAVIPLLIGGVLWAVSGLGRTRKRVNRARRTGNGFLIASAITLVVAAGVGGIRGYYDYMERIYDAVKIVANEAGYNVTTIKSGDRLTDASYAGTNEDGSLNMGVVVLVDDDLWAISR